MPIEAQRIAEPLCACGEALRRSVAFIPTGYTYRVVACLGCGATGLIESHGYEPRPGDIRHGADFRLALDPGLAHWFGRWPRVFHIVRDYRVHPGFIPSRNRFASAEDAAGWERGEEDRQLALSEGARLREAGVPGEPPPLPLEGELAVFHRLWDAIQRTYPADAPALIQAAAQGGPSGAVAADTLLRSPVYTAALGQAVADADSGVRLAAHAVIRAGRLADEALWTALLDELRRTPLARHTDEDGNLAASWRVLAFLDTLDAVRPETPRVYDETAAFARSLVRIAPVVARRIETALAHIEGRYE